MRTRLAVLAIAALAAGLGAVLLWPERAGDARDPSGVDRTLVDEIRAATQLRDDDPDAAIARLETLAAAQETDRARRAVLEALATTQRVADRPAEAAETYAALVALRPDTQPEGEAFILDRRDWRAEMLCASDQHEAGIGLFRDLLALPPAEARALQYRESGLRVSLIYCLEAAGRADEAMAERRVRAERAQAEAAPDNAIRAWADLANAAAAKGAHDEAFDAFRRVAALHAVADRVSAEDRMAEAEAGEIEDREARRAALDALDAERKRRGERADGDLLRLTARLHAAGTFEAVGGR